MDYIMQRIGVVGNGFVGNAIANGFKKTKLEVFVYDIDDSISTHSYDDVLSCEYVFVCLPTPMTHMEGGECNLSFIEKFFQGIEKSDSIFIIKSTVPIGTTRRLQEKYTNLKIVHNPEFLTAANAEYDFLHSDRHVIGGDGESLKSVEKLYKDCFPETPVFCMTSDESECVKYFSNSFLAAKVMVFNEMKILCEALKNIDYDKVIEGVSSDIRIGKSHTTVPGPDGEYGFGGTCFPKDINALIATMKHNGISPLVLESVWEQNKKFRVNWDWAYNPSAVSPLELSDA
tara:strand:+ start:1004 stop:1864 length:861 start_codon:yes stop_codon:yes gene_type:complete